MFSGRIKKSLWLLLVIQGCVNQRIPKGAIVFTAGQPFVLELASNLGQGYEWKLIDTSVFKVAEHSSKANPDQQQSTDLETFLLKTSARKGIYKITFYSLRPFDPISDTTQSKKTIKTIVVK